MKGVDMIARVRRKFFARGRTIKEIVRELRISRNAVRKILRSGEAEFTYEREHQPLPKIGPWKEQLDEWLTANASRSTQERLTLIRIYEELRGRGYFGGDDAIRRYARGWSKERAASAADACAPLTFAPGEAYLRGDKLAIAVFDSCDDIVDKFGAAWRFFANDPERIASIASRSWAKVNP